MKYHVGVLFLTLLILLALPEAVLAEGGGEGELPNLLTAISPGLQVLIEALVVALIPFLAYHARRWANGATLHAKQVLTMDQYTMAEIVVRNLVHAAEQIYTRAEGNTKKAHVLENAQSALAEYGLRVDMVHLEAMVESMVHQELKLPTGQAAHVLPA